VLACHHVKAFGLELWDKLSEAGAVGPEAMGENDTRFGHDISFWRV
jgi:hypothetical protein